MRYFTYENWRARGHVTKVHANDCPFCNNGKGMNGGTRWDNGRWIDLGVFDHPTAALAVARKVITKGTVRSCGSCS
jgi:hypothetical protein